MLQRRSALARTRSVPVPSMLAAACGLLLGSTAAGAQAAEQYGFVVLRGADTMVVERITRTPALLVSEMNVRQSGKHSLRAALLPEGLVSTFELRQGDSTASPAVALGFRGDSVVIRRAGEAETRLGGKRGAVPHTQWSVASAELVLRRFLALRVASAEVPLLGDSPEPTTVSVSRPAAGTVRLAYPEYVLDLRVDERGTLLGGCVHSEGISVERLGSASRSCSVTTP